MTSKGEVLSTNRFFQKTFDDKIVIGENLIEYITSKPEKIENFLQNCSRSRQMTIGALDFPFENDQIKTFRCEGFLLEPAHENNLAKIFIRLRSKEKADIRFALLTDKIEKLNKEILKRKRAEDKNKQLYKQAEDANRLKDEFLATISHELRTPLNSMLGWIKILQKSEYDQELYDKAFETIERNTRMQVHLIEDILDVSRIITGKLKLDIRSVELISIIEAAVDSVRPMAENKEIFLETNFNKDFIFIAADAARIQQIVWNFLTNALKFTPRGGSVRLSVKEGVSDVEIIVSDTGEGIPEEFLPYVFDRFLQADAGKTRKHGGLGLGLAIVSHLTELHGGVVNVKSKGIGKGATFNIKLPIISQKQNLTNEDKLNSFQQTDVPETANASNKNLTLKNLSLLIVDDEPDALELLKIILEDLQANVETATSAKEAFEKLFESNFDVLITDIAMPKEDGYSLIQKIRALSEERLGKIPAIALTAYARPQDHRQSISMGFDSHISKPFDSDELIAVIQDLAQGEKPD